MPRNYGSGRCCAHCGKALLTHQQRYCSVACNTRDHRYTKMSTDEVVRRMPKPDEVMANTLVWHDWARRCGVNPATFANRLRRMGFRRQPRSAELTHAPCSQCGESREVAQLDSERICLQCRAVNRPTLYSRELRRRQPGGDRFDELWKTERPYTGSDIYGLAPHKIGAQYLRKAV